MNVAHSYPDSRPADTERDGTRIGAAVIASADRWWWALLIAILLGGTLLRLDGWGDYWINGDEGLYYDVATQTSENAAEILARNAHPPLYYRLLRWTAAAGGGIPLMRASSLTAGVALILLVFLVGHRMGGRLVGLVAAFLMAISPGGVMLSQVIRPYMIQLAVLALGVLALLGYLDTRRGWHLAAYVVSMVIATLIHYGSVIVWGGAALFLADQFRRRRFARRDVAALAVAHAALLLNAAVLYLTHIAPHIEGGDLQTQALTGWLAPFFASDPLGALTNYVGVSWYAFGYWLSAAVSLLVIVAAWLQPPGRRRDGAWLTLLVLAVALVLAVTKLYPFGRTRHALYLGVLLAPAAGLAVDGLLRSRWRIAFGCGVVSILWLLAAGVSVGVWGFEVQGAHLLRELTIPRVEAESALRGIREETTPDDLILTDMQSLVIAAPLFGERIDREWIPGVKETARVIAGGRMFLVGWRWKLLETADVGYAYDLLHLLDRLRAQPTERWNPFRHRVWLLQGGWGESLLDRLPERLEDGRLLRGPIRGGLNLGVCRFYPDTYRINRERKTE